MGHPFGDLVRQYLSRTHGLSQGKLATGIDQDPAVVSKMCRGKRLCGRYARERVLSIIQWFQQQGVLKDLDEANALLAAAGMSGLERHDPGEARLIQSLRPAALAHSEIPPPFLAPALPPYRLVGRDDVLENLKKRLLTGEGVTLWALHGLPGVGKTTLAIALAHDDQVREHFRDGILWAPLGRQPDVISLLGTWAAALGISPERIARRTTIKERQELIRLAIGRRRMLLVIDDAWQPEAALALRVGGPHSAYIVTTRFPALALDFAGEGLIRVAELGREEGLTLLATLSPATVTAEPESASALVGAVGGLPLALALMGRYLRKEAEGEQPRRLRQALSRLHDATARLQLEQPPTMPALDSTYPESMPLSLLTVIGLSDESLDEPARHALYALSVFPPKPNTFSEEAAVAVTAEPPARLDTLYDAGLLESSAPGRYTLHQAIADYARAKLTDEFALERMASFFVQWVEAHGEDYQLLAQETENVLAALDAAHARRMQDLLVRGVIASCLSWEVRHLYALAETQLQRARQVAEEHANHHQLVTILSHLGDVCQKRGQYAQAEAYGRQGLALARQEGDHQGLCAMLQFLGGLAGERGDIAQSRELFGESLSLAQRMGNADGERIALQNLGVLDLSQGNYAQAEQYLEQGLLLARRAGHLTSITALLLNLGTVLTEQGRYEQAEIYYQEGLVLSREMGFRENICAFLANMGGLARDRGDYSQAAAYLDESLPLARNLEYPWLLCGVLREYGELLLKQEEFDSAEEVFQECLRIARKVNVSEFAGLAMYGLARTSAAQGERNQSRAWGQKSLEILRTIGHGKWTEVEKWLAGVQ